MSWLKTIVQEAYGLFVDDGWFAVAVLAWLCAVWLIRQHLAPAWGGILLFAGLALILLESTLRRSAPHR